jgi:hypothetical protein
MRTIRDFHERRAVRGLPTGDPFPDTIHENPHGTGAAQTKKE